MVSSIQTTCPVPARENQPSSAISALGRRRSTQAGQLAVAGINAAAAGISSLQARHWPIIRLNPPPTCRLRLQKYRHQFHRHQRHDDSPTAHTTVPDQAPHQATIAQIPKAKISKHACGRSACLSARFFFSQPYLVTFHGLDPVFVGSDLALQFRDSAAQSVCEPDIILFPQAVRISTAACRRNMPLRTGNSPS